MFCKEMYEKLAPPQGSVSRGVGSSGGGGGGDPPTRDNCKSWVYNCDDLLSYNATFLHINGAVGGHHKSGDWCFKIPLSDLPNDPYPEWAFLSAIYTIEALCVLRYKIPHVLLLSQEENQPPTPHRLDRLAETCWKIKICIARAEIRSKEYIPMCQYTVLTEPHLNR